MLISYGVKKLNMKNKKIFYKLSFLATVLILCIFLYLYITKKSNDDYITNKNVETNYIEIYHDYRCPYCRKLYNIIHNNIEKLKQDGYNITFNPVFIGGKYNELTVKLFVAEYCLSIYSNLDTSSIKNYLYSYQDLKLNDNSKILMLLDYMKNKENKDILECYNDNETKNNILGSINNNINNHNIKVVPLLRASNKS